MSRQMSRAVSTAVSQVARKDAQVDHFMDFECLVDVKKHLVVNSECLFHVGVYRAADCESLFG